MKQTFFLILTFFLFQCQSQEPRFEPKVIDMDSLLNSGEVEWREIDSCKYFYLTVDSIWGHSYNCPNNDHKILVKP
jgi:hypothetical protein